jgi:hypothetical protein
MLLLTRKKQSIMCNITLLLLTLTLLISNTNCLPLPLGGGTSGLPQDKEWQKKHDCQEKQTKCDLAAPGTGPCPPPGC